MAESGTASSSRPRWYIAGGIALVLVVAAVWVGWAWITRDEGRIATVSVSSSPWPEKYAIGKGAETRYEDFHGVMIGTSTVKDPSPEEDHCLMVVINDQIKGSCAPKSEDAFVKFAVGPAAPEALRDEFPEGTNIRVTFNGSDVVVHRDKAS
ncbi:hypothetical protein J2Y69_002988 [Microbacterium resistens]|uniref:DUF4333 domain-containing protein n=1 Tax=Microbacterium resistens TaxID=156977 RepID=A0ABU1SHN7_9MICO|nr:hypothetical protein [Microbacterium resistens]MDR6868372.1 hypothetical protein [Microbacterium resistens]